MVDLPPFLFLPKHLKFFRSDHNYFVSGSFTTHTEQLRHIPRFTFLPEIPTWQSSKKLPVCLIKRELQYIISRSRHIAWNMLKYRNIKWSIFNHWKGKEVGSFKPHRLSTKKINRGGKRPHMFAVPVLSS